jgi:hypothetical protein
MIILLISSTIWLTALVLVVVACRMSAHGDRSAPRRKTGVQFEDGRSPRLLDMAAGPWEQVLDLRIDDRRSRATRRVRSKTAAAEHVGNGAQKDLYVRP